MPTVLLWPPFRVVVYPNDHQPPHVHMVHHGKELIVGLGCAADGTILEAPQLLRHDLRLKHQEIKAVAAFVRQHQGLLVEKWMALHGHR